jgi:hypothetical protein
MNGRFFAPWTAALFLLLPLLVPAHAEPVTIALSGTDHSPDLSPDFLGLSYESSTLLPQNGRHYFDPNDKALLHTFQTLGIKSIRVGANAVDDPRIPIPRGEDIDSVFSFARAAGAKVIYSFRLKNGHPADSARLATYIAAHDKDALDCYSIGNEPHFYLKKYEDFFAQWKPHYDGAIYVTLINKTYGTAGNRADISLQLPKGVTAGQWTRMDLVQKDQDVAARTGVMLGGAPIDPQGVWSGQWQNIKPGNSGTLKLKVAPASATILHFAPAADMDPGPI